MAPGVAGAILVLLGLTALSMFPIDWLGAALMILGLVFFVLEAKFATHGVLTAGGAVALVLGAVMLIDTSVPELRIRLEHRHRPRNSIRADHEFSSFHRVARAAQQGCYRA